MRCKLNQQTREKNLERREKGMKRLLIAVILVIALLALPVSGVLAATSQDVIVTATPAYISITNTPSTWIINGITKSGVIAANTTYYSNPVGDNETPSATVAPGECYFSVNNTGTVNATINVNFSDFTGAGDYMDNSNAGTNTDNTFGAWSYYDGMTYTAKVQADESGSAAWSDNLTPGTPLGWGLEICTRETEWTSSENMTSTVTITAAVAS